MYKLRYLKAGNHKIPKAHYPPTTRLKYPDSLYLYHVFDFYMKYRCGIFTVVLITLITFIGFAQQKYSSSQLAGKWLRPISVVPPSGKAIKEGIQLTPDGRLDFVNINSMKGDKWELENDTLILWSHTERYPEPQPVKFVIIKLTKSKLEIKPENGVSGRKETYKRFK
jgi:hypothetical protein